MINFLSLLSLFFNLFNLLRFGASPSLVTFMKLKRCFREGNIDMESPSIHNSKQYKNLKLGWFKTYKINEKLNNTFKKNMEQNGLFFVTSTPTALLLLLVLLTVPSLVCAAFFLILSASSFLVPPSSPSCYPQLPIKYNFFYLFTLFFFQLSTATLNSQSTKIHDIPL